MATPVNTRVQNQNCCFWVKHSESCAQVKEAGAAIVAALAAIVLAAGVLLILAQQGYDLAGINSIANMVQAKWIYLGMGITGAIALIDVTLIIAQVHSYLNKTVSKEVLQKGELWDWLNEKNTVLQLGSMSFTAIEAGNLNQYVIVSKDDEGRPSYIAYHTQEDCDYHQMRLLQKGYADFREKQEYPPENIRDLIGLAQFQEWARGFSEDLEKGYYRSTDTPQKFSGIDVWPLAANQEGKIHLRFFATPEARQSIIDTEYANLWDKVEIDRLAQERYETQVLVTLQVNEFWTYAAKLGEKIIFFVAYQAEDEADITIQHFFNPKLREQFIKPRFLDENDSRVKFYASHTYTPEELRRLTDEGPLKDFEALEVEDSQYEKLDLAMRGRENLSVYALKVAGEAAVICFKTKQQRQDHIENKLKGFVDAQVVRTQET